MTTTNNRQASLPPMNWQKATCEVCGVSFDHLKKRRPPTCNKGECQYKHHYQVDRQNWASYQPGLFE